MDTTTQRNNVSGCTNTFDTLSSLHQRKNNSERVITKLDTFLMFLRNHKAPARVFLDNTRKTQFITILKISHIPSSRPTDGRCPTQYSNSCMLLNCHVKKMLRSWRFKMFIWLFLQNILFFFMFLCKCVHVSKEIFFNEPEINMFLEITWNESS